MNPRVRTKRQTRLFSVGLVLIACGGVLSKPQGGGESHFLYRCAQVCGGGLECVADICTRACLVGESSCADLLPTAICTDQSIEPGAVAVCDVGCSSASDCVGLGAGFECEAGFCRLPLIEPSPEPDAGAAGSGGEGGGSGSPLGENDCLVRASLECGGDEVCVDDPTDDCDADLRDDCPGTCEPPDQTPACSGLGGLVICPGGLWCTIHENDAPELDDVGICVGEELIGSCSETVACDPGFVCDIALHPGEPVGNCVPDGVSCGVPTCPAAVPEPCPDGYTHSLDLLEAGGTCFGACVPVNTCACELDADCPAGAACNRDNGRCTLIWAPPELCALAFDPGPCDAATSAYSAVDGTCVPQTYGGCEGNDNRFASIEECMAVCEGRPLANPCPAGRVIQGICLSCGQVGGCGQEIVACAEPCTSNEDCHSPGFSCFNGACSVAMCL